MWFGCEPSLLGSLVRSMGPPAGEVVLEGGGEHPSVEEVGHGEVGLGVSVAGPNFLFALSFLTAGEM